MLGAGGYACWHALTAPEDTGSLEHAESAPLGTADDQAAPEIVDTAADDDGGSATASIGDAAADANADAALPSTVESRLAACAPYFPELVDIATLSGQVEPFAFRLGPDAADTTPELSEASTTRLLNATAAFADYGWQAGCLLIDLGTGRGLAVNLDATAYGASAFKAPFALYLCETQLDTGTAALDTPCWEGNAAAFMDPDGTYLYDDTGSYPLGALVADSIVLSDNDSYRILRANFDAGLPDWLANLGLPGSLTDDWFPTYSVRTSGMVWLHAADYLDGSAISAPWLSALLEQSETSFLRDAVGADAQAVRGKAGWYADDDPAYCGLCDAGIVTVNDRDYLLCAMSSAPYSAEGEALLEELLAAAFAAREDLA